MAFLDLNDMNELDRLTGQQEADELPLRTALVAWRGDAI